MNHFQYNLCFLGVSFFTLISFSAKTQNVIDGFTLGKGNGIAALSYSWESYDEFYFGNEIMDAPAPYGGKITTQGITFYGAYGLTDHLDVIVNLPYINAMGNGNDEMVDQSVGNLQDLSLFLEWNPLEVEAGPGMLSFVGALGLSTPLSDYKADAVLSIGNQSTRLDGRLLMQYKAENGIFGNLQAGYSVRGNDVPNATLLGAKLGFATSKFYVDLWSETQISDPDAPDIAPGEVPFYETRVNYTQIGVNVHYPITPALGVSAGYGKYVDGRNVGKADRVTGGLVYNFSL